MYSHNVVTIKNITVGWKLSITKVIVENNGVWHANLTAPNTLLGVWFLEVELDNLVVLIHPLLGLDASIKAWIVLVNMKDYGRQTWC
jgi:hypothetical protein